MNPLDKSLHPFNSAIIAEEDKFYGYGFVTGPNVPVPECINDVIWYGATEQENIATNFNQPIC